MQPQLASVNPNSHERGKNSITSFQTGIAIKNMLTLVGWDAQVDLFSTESGRAAVHVLARKPKDEVAMTIFSVMLRGKAKHTIMAMNLRVHEASWLEDGP